MDISVHEAPAGTIQACMHCSRTVKPLRAPALEHSCCGIAGPQVWQQMFITDCSICLTLKWHALNLGVLLCLEMPWRNTEDSGHPRGEGKRQEGEREKEGRGGSRGHTSRLELVKLLEVDIQDAIHPPMDDRTKLCSHADVRGLVRLPAPTPTGPSDLHSKRRLHMPCFKLGFFFLLFDLKEHRPRARAYVAYGCKP